MECFHPFPNNPILSYSSHTTPSYPIPCHPSGRPFARRRPRHAGAVICTFTLGILALAPLLGPFRGGFFPARRGPDPTAPRRRNQYILNPAGSDSAESREGENSAASGTGADSAASGDSARGGLRAYGQPREEVKSVMTGRGDDSFLSPEELSGELLSDGRPRCEKDEEGENRCLPTVFFIGVSKCGE